MEDSKNNPIVSFIEKGNLLISDQGKALFLDESAETIATAALDSHEVFKEFESLMRDRSDIGSKRGAELFCKVLEVYDAILIIGMSRERLNNFRHFMNRGL